MPYVEVPAPELNRALLIKTMTLVEMLAEKGEYADAFVDVDVDNAPADMIRAGWNQAIWHEEGHGDEIVFTIPKTNETPKETVEVKCGTAGCFAGWAVTLKGGKSVGVGWLEAAQRALGLTMVEAGVLFAGDNTIEDLHEYVEMFLAGDRLLDEMWVNDDDEDDEDHSDGAFA